MTTGKWIVCKRDGKEYDPRTATPIRIADIASEKGYTKFNNELINKKNEYAYATTSYEKFFKSRNIKLNQLPTSIYS